MIYSTIKDLFKGICDAIRSKDGTAEEINHQDIPSRIQAIQSGLDTTDATATAGAILKGKTAYAKGSKVTGSMADNGAVTKTLDSSTTSYTVPAGYHNGSGKVNISTETKTATPTTGSQTVTPSSGKVLSKVTVNAIPSQYVDTSDATATAANIQNGKTAYVNGEKITGTHVENSGLDTSDATATAGDILSGKTAYVNGSKVTGSIAAKSESDITASGKTVTVPAGYYASSADKSVETATQATPTISVDNSGKITATSEQSAGYVAAGTKSATKQLSTQAAQTITPGTADQTLAAGQYLSGAQTIKGDANLVAGNIKSGVSIFGVAGTYVGSGGSGGGIQAQHITSASDTITISGSGTVKVWGYGYYSSGMYTKTIYAFVGDGYYTASSYGTPSKHSATFGINADGTLSGLPSNVSTIDALITIGA